jgi:arylsulfatase A-like enzyme
MKKFRSVIALFIFLSCWNGVAAEPGRPNIVFVLVDDLRADAVGCMGHPFVKTPHIDRLAKEGVLFKNFFVSLPLCSPSRASFLTGQYAHTHGVIDNTDHSALSHKLVTFPKLLRDAGYETAYVGKWHMGGDDSPRPGFDRWVSFKGQGVYASPMINVAGTASRVEGYMTDILNQHAVDFVKAEHKKPFVLYLAHKAVHGPFTPAERHQDLYSEDEFKPSPNLEDTLEGKLALTRKLDTEGVQKKKNPKKAKQKAATGQPTGRFGTARNQLRSLASIDDGVGLLYKALDERKLLDNTVFIFTSDNGYFWGEHGLGDKRWAYEESIRAPLLLRFPKQAKAGTTRDQLVINVDIAPTLLELGGAPIPKSMQGKSLVPLLADPNASWRKSIYTEYYREPQTLRVPTWQAVRTDRWKYIRYTELTNMDELYDLKADPYELKNLVKDSATQNTLKELQAELQRLRSSPN